MTSQLTQTGPGNLAGLESPEGAPQRITLRRSFTLWSLSALSIVIAAIAVEVCFASRWGVFQAAPAALAVLACLALAAIWHWRAEPGVIHIGPDGLTVWNRSGKFLARGRVAGCSQWSGRLLMLALAGPSGSPRSLLVSADALPAEAFRQLAVLGRHAARV